MDRGCQRIWKERKVSAEIVQSRSRKCLLDSFNFFSFKLRRSVPGLGGSGCEVEAGVHGSFKLGPLDVLVTLHGSV